MRIINICAKCSDMFSATLTADGKYKGQYDGYVPDFFPGEHYGDYIQFEIDVDTGHILNWNEPTTKDLKIFKSDNEV